MEFISLAFVRAGNAARIRSSPAGHSDPARGQRFAQVIRMGQVENRVADQHQQLFMLAVESSSQRLLARLDHDALSDPLPELSLRRPELFAVAANHERRFLPLFSLCFLRPHLIPALQSGASTPPPAHGHLNKARTGDHAVPPFGGSLSSEAASIFQVWLTALPDLAYAPLSIIRENRQEARQD